MLFRLSVSRKQIVTNVKTSQIANYYGYDKAAFGHVRISDESDIKLVKYSLEDTVWYKWRNPSCARKQTRGGKVCRHVTTRFVREVNVAVEKKCVT